MLRLGSSALIGTTRSSRRIVAKALRQAFSNPLTDDNSVGIDP
jgi:cell division GTPase FtsZ